MTSRDLPAPQGRRRDPRGRRFDPFEHYKKDELTVGALRAKAKAAGVDTSPKSSPGAKPITEGDATRPVTSGDIVGMFQQHAKAA